MTHDPTPVPSGHVLLNPGPVNVDEHVRQALVHPDVCHREPEVASLIANARAKVTSVCAGAAASECATVILTGSGTAALEAAICSVVPPDGRALILDNGHYGERLLQIAQAHAVPHTHLAFGWAAPLDVAAVERALRADRSITHVAMVHHETSTGMLNPLHGIGELAAGMGASLIVDAISSLGSESLDLFADHVDWCVGTANKCLEGLPGVSFVCAPRPALEALAKVPPRGYYLDLHRHHRAQEHERAPAFTPAVQVLYAFDRALDLMLAETVAVRGARYAARARVLREGLSERGFCMLLAPEHRCNSVTVAHLPPQVRYEQLHDGLKQRGFVIYATQAELGRMVRIANMGQIAERELERFFVALDDVLAELDEPVAEDAIRA